MSIPARGSIEVVIRLDPAALASLRAEAAEKVEEFIEKLRPMVPNLDALKKKYARRKATKEHHAVVFRAVRGLVREEAIKAIGECERQAAIARLTAAALQSAVDGIADKLFLELFPSDEEPAPRRGKSLMPVDAA